MISAGTSNKSSILSRKDTTNLTFCYYRKMPVVAHRHKIRFEFTKEHKVELRYVCEFL